MLVNQKEFMFSFYRGEQAPIGSDVLAVQQQIRHYVIRRRHCQIVGCKDRYSNLCAFMSKELI